MMNFTIIANLCHVPGKVRFPFLAFLPHSKFNLFLGWSLIPSSIDSESMVDGWLVYYWPGWIVTNRELFTPGCMFLPISMILVALMRFFCTPLLTSARNLSRTQSCREMRFVWLTGVAGCTDAPFFLLYHNSCVYLYLSVLHLLSLRAYATG